MFGREIKFKINGEDTTDKALFIVIPERYADMFEGHNFPSDKVLSQAVMYAGCAYEAWAYRKPWLQEDYEWSLKETMKITA